MEDNDFTNRIKVFSHVNVDSTIDELPGEKRSVDIFQHFIRDKLLERIAQWTNEWSSSKCLLNLALIMLNWKPTLAYYLKKIKTLISHNMSITFAKMTQNGYFSHPDSTRNYLRREFQSFKKLHFLWSIFCKSRQFMQYWKTCQNEALF